MIPALVILLSFQLAGEIAARGLGLPVPGPVIGLLLLVASCSLRPRLAEMLRPVTLGLLGNLSLFFVPAGVGVVAHLGEFRSDGLAIALAQEGGIGIVHRDAEPAEEIGGRRFSHADGAGEP